MSKQQIDSKTELVKLLLIYQQMDKKVLDLHVLLTELTTRLENHEDEDAVNLLKEIKEKHLPEKIEALMGEIIEIYHYEQKESKKALIPHSVSLEEYQAWMKREVEEINKEIISLRPIADSHWQVHITPLIAQNPIIVGYAIKYSNIYFGNFTIEIHYLKPTMGTFRKKVLTVDNFDQFKMKRPLGKVFLYDDQEKNIGNQLRFLFRKKNYNFKLSLLK